VDRALSILYEDNHLLAVNKPAGLPTMGAAPQARSLLELAKRYIKQRYNKPGNVYLGVVSRLDAPVTGVVVLARNSKAARRLTEQFRTRSVRKIYWAIVEGRIRPECGTLVDWLVRDKRHRRVRVAGPDVAGAQQSELSYKLLCLADGNSLLEITLHTGRKHQIRVQLARHGHPIVGDVKYGSRQRFAAGGALHARQITVGDPVKRQPVTITGEGAADWGVGGGGEGMGVGCVLWGWGVGGG
jgi:23S rRNA pseudouridine1911/1915/1917 synthase